MKELLDKISSYNIFNYLLPGVLFSIIVNKFTHYSLPIDNAFVGAFLCYFIGLIISRIGSLIIEPLLRFYSFLKFADYADFIAASKKDSKIEVLSEVNNTYRTLLTMLTLIPLVKFYEFLESKISGLNEWSPYILILTLLIMFLFSYRKQTDFVRKRVDANK